MNPDPAQMEAALRLIGGDCERLTRGLCPDEPNWSPYCEYTADRWCDPCIARAGLAGTLPGVGPRTDPGCGCPVKYVTAAYHTRECSDRRSAVRYADELDALFETRRLRACV